MNEEKKDSREEENEKEKKKKEDPSLLPDELQKMIEDHLQDEELKKRVKVVRFGKPVLSKRQVLLKTILTYVIDFILILSVSGYIRWVNADALHLLAFSVTFTTIELIIKFLIVRYLPKLLMYSMGTVFIAVTIVTFALSSLIYALAIINQMQLVWFLVVFIITRSIIANILVTQAMLQYKKNKR